MKDKISKLPLIVELETKPVMRALVEASRLLSELKGEAKLIPNEEILINSLVLQEAKDSSEIENIVTTHDEIFKAGIDIKVNDLAAKEVQNYISALKYGYTKVKELGLITNNIILGIQEKIEQNKAGFRKVPGTALKNSSGETVYTPPQDYNEIKGLMDNLEKYINNDFQSNLDPLLMMCVIHYQFESIHPFYDGNGRSGRIINLLFLVKEELLDSPILYLSRYIIENKAEYYTHLQNLRETNIEKIQKAWENWLVYMLNGVITTAKDTIKLIGKINNLMTEITEQISGKTNFYSPELLDILFRNPYSKVAFLEEELSIHRQTASSYLSELCKLGLLEKKKIGRNNYFVNIKLFELLKEI